MRWFARDLWRQGEVDMQRDHNLRHKGTAPNPHSAQYGNFLFQKSWRKVVGGSSRGSCQYQVCKQLTCPWLYQLDAQTPQTTDLDPVTFYFKRAGGKWLVDRREGAANIKSASN